MMNQTERALMIASQAGNGEHLLNNAGALYVLAGCSVIVACLCVAILFFALNQIAVLIDEMLRRHSKSGSDDEET